MLIEIVEMIIAFLLFVAWLIMFAMITFGDWRLSRKSKKGNDKR